jgi:hypothetical protein
MLLVVLYGCEAWYPITREESMLGLFGKRVLRKIDQRRRT